MSPLWARARVEAAPAVLDLLLQGRRTPLVSADRQARPARRGQLLPRRAAAGVSDGRTARHAREDRRSRRTRAPQAGAVAPRRRDAAMPVAAGGTESSLKLSLWTTIPIVAAREKPRSPRLES